MDAATVHRHRSLLPAINLLLAGGAAVLAVAALASDDVGSMTTAPRTSVPTDPPPIRHGADIPAYDVLIVDEECGMRIRGNVAC
jgi:hypothetical protein